ncbi:MAG: thioredoxin family protein [Erysipelotrichaceae bacterium]
MKKVLLILATLALLLTGCSKVGPSQVEPKEVTKMLDNNETLVVYVGYKACSACQSFKPVVTELIKNYDVKVYYVDTYESDKEDLADLIDTHLGEVEYTPTTFIFKDGLLLDSKVGALGYLALKNWFVKHGVITE